MKPYFERGGITIFHGDCREILKSLPDCSVDSVVTDPPAGIGFMGKTWDKPGVLGVSGGVAMPATTSSRNPSCRACGGRKRAGPKTRSCTCESPDWNESEKRLEDRDNFVAFICDVMKECLRILKPGGHAVVWSIPRTSHWTAWGIEDAGFEIRDCVLHLFGSGFSKSLDVSKAIDKAAGIPKEGAAFKAFLGAAVRASGKSRKQIDLECGFTMRYDTPYEKDPVGWGCTFPGAAQWEKIRDVLSIPDGWERFIAGVERQVIATQKRKQAPSGIVSAGRQGTEFNRDITLPTTDAAKQWNGWGTALKPAAEYWWLCRKPLEGTVAANVQEHGTGALNIDGCRVDYSSAADQKSAIPQGKATAKRGALAGGTQNESGRSEFEADNTKGRWPANVTHDGSDEVLSQFPEAPGQLATISDTATSSRTKNAYGKMNREGEASAETRYTESGGTNFAPLPGQRRNDSGSAARFFYCAKASTADRGRFNNHPTVKPIDLMRWLCRLVTPPDGTVLDCFMGSGSTLIAAREEGFKAIGIEREEAYIEIAKRRIGSQGMLDFSAA